MKRILKVTGAICLGIFIWVLLMVCLLLIWKTKAGSFFPMQGLGQEEIYFDSMQEAINANYLNFDEEDLYQCNLENVIKEFEINNYIILCYSAIKNPREEAFIIAYFKTKGEGEDKKYAYVWNEIQELEYSKKRKIELEELIKNQIEGSNFRMMNSINDEKRFVYGTIAEIYFEEEENVYNLNIEGQKPDEIIEFNSLGGKRYFWYFNNFQSDKSITELEIALEK
ncbi:MAG: hypothetical protein NC347_08785 [Clostridium sp.]|nr:hypothetical protein [Clostridium sp.]